MTTDIKLPEPYQRAVYATAKNTASVRKGYEMGGYVKTPDLYTADHLRAAIAAERAPVAAALIDLIDLAENFTGLAGGNLYPGGPQRIAAARATLRALDDAPAAARSGETT